MTDNPTGVRRILDWLRAGYPEGIPPQDYPPVLGVLQRNLTDEEIGEIAEDLALQSMAADNEPVTAADVQRMVRERAFQRVTAGDLRRVSAQLAAGGWPLSVDLSE
ncbi:MAG TPA: DUF3349 domain-containing protein [Marmoricola sp.]|jgi:hypothetical protein|nr:DUF3349 domain-containing protein [Marmoricola sp.]